MLAEITLIEDKLNGLLNQHGRGNAPCAELLAATREWSAGIWKQAEQLGPLLLTNNQIARGRRLIKRPVYVCGVHRSGTTLVRDLLDNHPELVVLPSEGTYFTNMEAKLRQIPGQERMIYLGTEWLRRLVNPINQPPYWLLGRSTEAGSPYLQFARYFMVWWQLLQCNSKTQWPHFSVVLAYASVTNNLSAKYWVDKTPINERYLKRIWKERPDARIIHVIRDPVAVLNSRKKMEPGFSIRAALSDLRVSFSVALKRDPRIFVIRYEELCKTPAQVSAQITTFLDIDYSSSLIQPTVAGLPSAANSSFKCANAPGDILQPGEHEQDAILTRLDRSLMLVYIGRLANKLDYKI